MIPAGASYYCLTFSVEVNSETSGVNANQPKDESSGCGPDPDVADLGRQLEIVLLCGQL